MGLLREVLRLPDLRRLEAAWGFAQIGGHCSTVALFVYAYAEGGALAAAAYGVGRTVPAGLVTPYLVAATARLPIERLLRHLTLARALLQAVAAVGIATGQPVALVIALATVSASMAASFRPLQALALPWLVRTPEELTAANVTATLADNVAVVVGPLLAAGVLYVAGADAAMFAATGSLAVAAGWLLRVRVPMTPHARTAGARVRGEVVPGVRLLGEVVPRMGFVVLILVQTFARGLLLVLVVVLVLDRLAMADGVVGLVHTAMGLGGLVGGLAAASLVRLTRLGRSVVVGVVGWGLGVLAVAGAVDPAVVLLAMALVGFSNSIVDAGGFTLVPRLLRPRDAATALGVVEVIALLGIGSGSLVAPALADWLGLRTALAASGGLLLLAALLYWPTFRRVDATIVQPGPELALLRGLPMFAGLPVAVVEQLASTAAPRRYEPGQPVMRQGEPSDVLHVICSGRAAVTVDGSPRPGLGPGECFGEIALLRDVPRTATVMAAEPLETLTLQRDEFLVAVTGNSAALVDAEALVESRLRRDRSPGDRE